jgi:hypothetical protein
MDYSKYNNEVGMALLVDFEKAFDSIEWNFLIHSLESFGFGKRFIEYVRLLYANISTTVLNNGYLSENFNPSRGIRQGCPASAYLFIIAAELLAIHIRNSPQIRGLTFGHYNYRIQQFADDTILFLKDKTDLKAALNSLNAFYYVSGLKINKDKSILINLGTDEYFPEKGQDSLQGVKWCKNHFVYLGITFTSNPGDMEYKNFRHKLDKMNNLTRIWRQRDLSLRGKVQVLKSLVVSQLQYPLTMLDAPQWVYKEANDIMFGFLWKNKPDKIKRDIIIQELEDGGLKMVDIDSLIRAQKAKWAIKIYENIDAKWCNFVKNCFDTINLKYFMSCNYSKAYLPANLPNFYFQCLHAYSDLHVISFDESDTIRQQSLWFNKFIKVANKHIFWSHWYAAGILYIDDILAENNKFLTYERLCRKYNLKQSNFLEYMSLCSAIPKMWKDTLSSGQTGKIDLDPKVEIDGVVRHPCYTSSKEIYKHLVKMKKVLPVKALRYWSDNFNISEDDMIEYYLAAKYFNRESKIHAMQYKIMLHFFPCRKKLFDWRVKESRECYLCKNPIDDIIHHFARCPSAVVFWRSLGNWWGSVCSKCNFDNVKCQVLGFVEKVCHKPQLNFICSNARWYIYREKLRGEDIHFLHFLPELKRKILAEEYIYKTKKQSAKFEDMWRLILDGC